jgi:hypothetical protein
MEETQLSAVIFLFDPYKRLDMRITACVGLVIFFLGQCRTITVFPA